MDFTDPHFAAPAWLWMALLAPAAFALLCVRAARARARQLDTLVTPEARPALLRSHSPARRTLKHILTAVALALVGVALARPQWGRQIQAANLQGEDVVVILDCSKSMWTADVRPNRIERARLAILDFIQSRRGGRIALVAFAGQAFVQCPLTFDYDAFRECLMAVDEKTIPVQGTDLGRALDQANAAMEKGSRRKLMILVTDGEDLEGGGVQKAGELAKDGVIVCAVGVGTTEGRSLQAPDGRGGVQVVRDAKGEVVTSKLDATTLRAVATVTGGTYQTLGVLGGGLIRAPERLQTAGDSQPGTVRAGGIDRFHWFIGAALVLLVLESLIGTRRRISETATA